MLTYQKFKESLSIYPSLIFLIIANLSILAYIILNKATAMEILLIYWMESAVIGFFNVLKMGIAGWGLNPKEHIGNIILKIFLIPFFIVHYGIFMIVHFIFIIVITSINDKGQTGPILSNLLTALGAIAIPILILLISHGYSFIYNFILKEEYKNANPHELMGQPYIRVIVMHLVIIFGTIISGLLMKYYPNLTFQIGLIMLFILLKTIADIIAHIKERRKMEVHMSNEIKN